MFDREKHDREKHGRDGNDQSGGTQQGCQFTYREGLAVIRIIARHGFKLSDTLCAQLVAGHRAE